MRAFVQRSPGSALPCDNPSVLFLGCGFETFLSIKIPSCVEFRNLKQARLILFKIPEARPRYCARDRYRAYPLLDFFSAYGYLFAAPNIDDGRGLCFSDDPGQSVLEIDVTEIVGAWLDGTIENKGLVLTGPRNTCPIACASNRHEIAGMHPFLRLIYDDITICQPLSVMPCTVDLDF